MRRILALSSALVPLIPTLVAGLILTSALAAFGQAAKPAPAAAPAAAPSPAAAAPAKVEAKPAAAPAKPEAKPEPKPDAKPQAKPPAAPAAAKPEAKPEPKPEAKPAAAASAKPEAKPAPQPGPQPGPLMPKVVDSRGQEVSLAVLAQPATAERFKLTEAQKTQIAALLAEREAALSKTPAAQRPAKLEETEQKMAAVLTEAQRADFIKTPPEPLLKFNFRYQRWWEVLKSVADQAGLSLVLEAPPPGTFNYTSDKEYTPAEAINALNSVLITKGFALIQRDKLLHLLDISESVPEGIVPQVKVDDLPKRQSFDWVSVRIPLEGRPMGTIDKDVQPLLGSYGKAVPMATIGQVLVTGTASSVKDVVDVIKAIPLPVAKPVPTPPKPDPSSLKTYELKGFNPEFATKLAETVAPAPTGKVFVDTKADRLVVYATESAHTILKAALEQLKAGVPPEKQPKLELYPVDEAVGERLVKSLETVVPAAKLWMDSRSGKLAAWAPAAEQATIKQIVEKLGPGGLVDREQQVEVYPLTKADPTTTVTLLSGLFPSGAKFVAPASSKYLVAVAPASVHKSVREMLAQIQTDKPGPDTMELKFYPITRLPATQLLAALKAAVPKADITADATAKQLLAVATRADQATVKTMVEQYEKEAPKEEKSKLVSYPVTPAQRKRFQTLMTTLTTELPGVTVLTDTEPNELAIWARPEQHKTIADLLKQLQTELPGAEKYQLGVYPVAGADPANTLAMLKSLYPNTQIIHDTKSGRFLVWSSPADLASVKKSIDELQAPVPVDKQPTFETYLLHGVDTSTIVASVQPIVPNAKITLDAKNSKLIVYALPAEHALLRTAIAKFTRTGAGVAASPQLEIYHLSKADPSTVVTTLTTLVPEARLTVETASKSIIAVAVPDDHKTIKSLIEQLDSEKPAPNAPQLRFYPLAQTPTSAMVTLLQTLAPKAQVTLDPGGKRLTVVATAADHVSLKAALDQIEKLAATDEKNKLVTYRVTAMQRKRFTSLAASLTTELPGMQVLSDSEPNELSVVAKPSQHVVIADMLEQLKRETPTADKYQLSAYPLRTGDATGVVALLQKLYPNAQFTYDSKAKRIMVWASAAEQAAIGAAIQKIDAAAPADGQDKLMIYPVPDVDVTTAIKTLTDMGVEAKLTSDTKAGTLLAWGAPADHVTIAKVLRQMQTAADTERKPTLVAYPVPAGDLTAVAQIVRTLVPRATVTVDTKSSTLVASAVAADHPLIRQAVDQMTRQETATNGPRFVRYTIPNATATTVSTLTTLLTQQFPNAHFGPGVEPGQLIAWARAADQEAIKAAIDVITEKGKVDNSFKLIIYELEAGGASTVTNVASVLRSMFPEGGYGPWVGPHQLAAWARAGDHAKIKQMIDELVKKPSPANAPRMVVYTITSPAPGGASTVVTTLRQIFPEIQLTAGSEPNKLIAWARPSEHAELRKAIRTLTTPEPPETAPKLTIYSVEVNSAAGITGIAAMLRSMYPDAQVTLHADPDKVMVLARPAEQVKIAATLAEMSKTDPPEKARRLAAYPFTASASSSPVYAMTVLRSMYPDVTFSISADGDKILAFARPAEHAKIKDSVAALAHKDAPENARTLAVYALDSAPAGVTGAINLLTAMYPDARFSAGAEANKINVLARAADHKLIAPMVAELGKKEPAEKARRVAVYPFRSSAASGAYYALYSLRQMFPEATFSPAAEPDKIAVFARPDDQAAIKAAIDELAKEDPKNAKQMLVYSVKLHGTATTSGIISSLTTMYPDATFNYGNEPDKVIAYARPEEQKRIAKTLEEFNRPETPGRERKIVVYPFKSASPTASYYTRSALATMFPDATISLGAEPDKLVVVARADDHVKIAQAIRDASKGESPRTAKRTVVYAVKLHGPYGVSGIISTLATMYPNATFNYGNEPDKFVAVARPDEHKKIARFVEEINKPDPPERARRLAVYPFKSAGASASYYTLTALRTMFPDATFSTGAEPDKLVVFARGDEHAKIKAAIDEVSKVDDDPKTAKRTVVYSVRLHGGSISGVYTTLVTMYPDATFTYGTEPDKIMALARPDEHAKIKQTIEEINKPDSPERAKRLAVYPFKSTSASAAYYTLVSLRTMFPDATFSQGAEPDKLVVFARADEHAKIEAAIKEVSEEDPKRVKRTVVYTVKLQGGTISGVYTTLVTMYPDATFTYGTDPDKIMALARPDDQKKIKQTIDQINKPDSPERVKRLVVYPFKSAGASAAYYTLVSLRTMFPDATFSQGAEPDKLVVFARSDEHSKIKAAIEEVSKVDDDPKTAKRTVVYTVKLQGGSISGVYTTLATMYPDATFTYGTEPDKIMALARPDEQKKIAQTIEEINKPTPPERARRLAVYPFKSASATGGYYTLVALRAMFPDATFSQGAEPDKVVVFAPGDEHARIKAAIEEVSQAEDDPKTAKRTVVYTIKLQGASSVSGVYYALTAMYPNATVNFGNEPDRLVVVARPDDHKKIAATIEELNKPEPPETAKRIVVYPFQSVSPMASVYTIMALRNLFPSVDFSVGAERDKIVVLARPDEHVKVKQAIEQLSQKDPPERARKMVVYTLRSSSHGGVTSAISLLGSLFHDAQFMAGSAPDKLVALARPDEHAKIKQAIEELSRKDEPEKAFATAVYDVEAVGYASAVTFLSAAFPDAQFGAGTDPNKLLARARPEDQAEIKIALETLDSQVRKAAASDTAAKLQLYPLKDLDATSTLQVVTQLLQKQGAAPELSLDMRTNSLVAIARPEHQKAIAAALAQLQTDERTLDIVPLEVLEASTAEMAIGRLFSDSRYGGRRGAPTIDSDPATGQLFIRGTAEQHKKIRGLLIRMGETSLPATPGDDARRTRTVPFDGDVQAAVEEIRKVWPQLRDNPIRVVTPTPQIIIRPRPKEPAPQQPGPASEKPSATKPPVVRPLAGPDGAAPTKLPVNEAKPPVAKAAAEKPVVEKPASAKPLIEKPAVGKADAKVESKDVEKSPAEPPADDKPAAQKPVVIMPGDGTITITSDDPAAAAQFEELLRGLSRQRGVVGRNYSIFMLKNATATDVAATIRNLVRSMSYTTQSGLGSVVVVPDDRLNALIVYANRTDRNTVENLLKVLDSSEVPETLSADRLSSIPVKNMSAYRMLRMIRELHPSHAEGVSADMKSNSLLVMASPSMTEQIQQLVEKLDKSAGGPSSRTIEIVPLKKISSERAEKALEILMRRPRYNQ